MQFLPWLWLNSNAFKNTCVRFLKQNFHLYTTVHNHRFFFYTIGFYTFFEFYIRVKYIDDIGFWIDEHSYGNKLQDTMGSKTFWSRIQILSLLQFHDFSFIEKYRQIAGVQKFKVQLQEDFLPNRLR